MVLTGKSLALCTLGFQWEINLLAIILAVWFTISSTQTWQRTFVQSGFTAGLRFTYSVPKALGMGWKRSIVRSLKLEYLLSILGKPSILPKQYVNSKLDNFTCDCHSERMIMQLVRVVSRRNANIFSYVLSWTSGLRVSSFVTLTLSCIVVNTTKPSLPDFFCQFKKQWWHFSPQNSIHCWFFLPMFQAFYFFWYSFHIQSHCSN